MRKDGLSNTGPPWLGVLAGRKDRLSNTGHSWLGVLAGRGSIGPAILDLGGHKARILGKD